MKLLLPLLAVLALPTAVNAFGVCLKKKKKFVEIEPLEKEMNLVLNKHITIAKKI